MITLKIGRYSHEEQKTLTVLIENALMQTYLLSPKCGINHCNTCKMRHLCIDLLQAYTYAKDYVVKK